MAAAIKIGMAMTVGQNPSVSKPNLVIQLPPP